MASSNQLWMYDTTLRDGAQREGLSLSVEDKLNIAQRLDELGIPFIEGGWPGANPKDGQFFAQLQQYPLQQAEVIAFCSTRRPRRPVAEDVTLAAALAARTNWVTLFGKSWDLHVKESLKTDLSENLSMIYDSIAYLKKQKRRVIYDAEHWFDGYLNNPAYAVQTLEAAIRAGAEWLVLCDTNGGMLPHQVKSIVRTVSQWLTTLNLATPPRLGIHTHNDGELAVANALTAVLEGATMVQGTMNGYGERCGNANLCSLIPNLQLKLGYDCLLADKLATLAETSRYISEIVNLAPDDHAPYVGLSAFAHKGGIHVSAVERNPKTYEHIEPAAVGNLRRIVISDQAGLSNIMAKARSFGLQLDRTNPTSRQLLQRLKSLEDEGYQFEAAEASFELLMREALGERPTMFEVHGFQVHCDRMLYAASTVKYSPQNTASSYSLATVKVAVDGKDLLYSAEGNGPVEALDHALRKALERFYPELERFYLTDYKVRILDSASGTAAKTRVLVEFSDGERRWTTVGLSPNILEASYQAVVEGLEYGLLKLRLPVKAKLVACQS
ncbi:MAG: citramalate synthase [Cyanobacteria bacterium P01_F01_bin.13]